MPSMPSTFRPPWQAQKQREQRQQSDERRGSARERGYNGRWEKARKAFLLAHPLCGCCLANGRAEPARIVDHIVPHKGDQTLFWDRQNWQGLCDWCDKNIKRAAENKWLRQGGDAGLLRLDYAVPGWVHPGLRSR